MKSTNMKTYRSSYSARKALAVAGGLDGSPTSDHALEIKSILVPTDFSLESKKALAYALPFARQFGAKLTLLHVVEPLATPDFARAFPLMLENDKVIANCKHHLNGILKDLEIQPKFVERILIRNGPAFNEIADAAKTLKVDLIIIATHGHTGLKHALLGSTTERVVRHAPCPVLVVRSLEHEFLKKSDNQPEHII